MKVKMILENNDSIVMELYPEIAPLSVANFLELIDKKYYDGVIFHRIIKDFMVQTGGYRFIDEKQSIVEAGDAKSIKGEFMANGVLNNLKHKLGVVSMARTMVKDSASSQFFICTKDAPHLDGQYAAFGKVVDDASLEVLEKLNNSHTVNVGGGLTDFPYPIVRIKTIERVN